jgi:hypothetical protein
MSLIQLPAPRHGLFGRTPYSTRRPPDRIALVRQGRSRTAPITAMEPKCGTFSRNLNVAFIKRAAPMAQQSYFISFSCIFRYMGLLSWFKIRIFE